MRIFKTKWFVRYALRAHIDDDSLKKAIERAESGLIDAELGRYFIKMRIPRKNQGRSSGYRTLIAYERNNRAIFLYGFAKNDCENIDDGELMSLKEIARNWIKAKDEAINRSLANGLLQEVDDG